VWLGDFLQLHVGEIRKGYFKQHVTRYMHCFAYHVPFFISKYGNLSKFSGQAVEKNNDVIKSIHQRKSSNWDGPFEALKFRKRLEYANNENIARPKREYIKQSNWWQCDIYTQRKEKKIQQKIQAANMCNLTDNGTGIDLESSTEVELQSMLSDLQSKKTRIRNRQKLINAIKELKYMYI